MDLDYDSPSGRTQDTKGAFTRERSVRHFSALESLLSKFTSSERLMLYALSAIFAISALALLAGANDLVSVSVPVRGGTLTEGEVGPARFINPVLTLSGADQDLTELVYSGLMRALPDGSYIPDLASSYDISDDGTVYTFHLRIEATFQDGKPLTAADVLYTVSLAQNADFRSPRQADWVGVEASSPDAHTVVFRLPRAYAPFIENTTMGILPKHLWESVTAEEFPFSTLNTHPIGSGPYRISKAVTDQTGAVTRYELVPFSSFALGEAYLKRITFLFYSNESELIKAFNTGEIDAIASISPADIPALKRADARLVTASLPRVFGIFFNQNHAPVLSDASVREALDAAVDKDAIVHSVLGGFGVVLDGPLPPLTSTLGPSIPQPLPAQSTVSASSTPNADLIARARAILERGGWSFDETANAWTKKSAKSGSASGGKDTLSFTLATADQKELLATADQVVADWRALGINVTLQVYPISEFNTTILRPRAYDAVLFGEVVGRSLDLFAFWHSSQRNDPGLNLAMYANSRADSLLSEGRAKTDSNARQKLYAQFAQVVEKDRPAVFLYAPQFLYVIPKNISGIGLGALATPSERFLDVYSWHTDTTRVWSIFTNR